MNLAKRKRLGVMLSPKRRRIRVTVLEQGSLRRLEGYIEVPKKKKIEVGRIIEVPGLNHGLPIVNCTYFGKRVIWIAVVANPEAVNRLAVKRGWRELHLAR